MKTIIIAILFSVTANQLSAQQTAEQKAEKQTAWQMQKFSLTSEQREKVYHVNRWVYNALDSVKKSPSNKGFFGSDFKKIESLYESKLSHIYTPEQMKLYLTHKKQFQEKTESNLNKQKTLGH